MYRLYILSALILFSTFNNTYSQQDDYSIDSLRSMSIEDLLNINVVTASKVGDTNLEAPALITLYTKSDIHNTGYYTLGDLANITPGYSSFTIYGEKVFETRGQKAGSFNNNRHLLLIDGIPVNHSRNYKASTEEELPLFFADKIEFLRGPASALYGISAFYGVINVLSEDPTENGINIDSKLSFGNKDMNKRLMTNIKHKSDNGISKLSIGFFEKEASKEFVGINKSNDNLFWDDRISIFLYTSHKFTKGFLNGLSTGLIYLSKSGGLGEHWTNGEFTHQINELKWENFNLFVKYDKKLNDNLLLNSYFKYNTSTERGWIAPFNSISYNNYNGTGQVLNYYNAKIRNLEGLVEITYSGQTFNLIGGIDIDRRYQLGDDGGSNGYGIFADSGDVYQKIPGLFKESEQFGTYSGFLQLKKEFDVLNGLFITVGFRNDYGKAGTETYNQLSPRLGIVQNITKNFTGKLLYSTALRAPGLKEITLNLETKSRLQGFEPPDLKAEKIGSFEASLMYYNPKYLLSITGFYNETTDILSAAQTGIFNYFKNMSGKIKASGLEAEFKYQNNQNFKSFLNYSFAKAEDKDGNEFFDVPSQKANLGFTFYHQDIYSATGILKWIDKYRVGDTGIVMPDGSLTIDLNFVYKLNDNLNVELFIENITDEDYKHPKNGIPDVPMPGRSFTFSAEISF